MAGLAAAALFLASCDSGSKGSDPQVEDSSSSVTDPTSSGSVPTSSGSVISSSSSAKSSSSTQINSSGSVITSSGSTQSSSSGIVSSSSGEADCTWQCVDACEGTVVWSSPTKQSICQSGEWVELSSSSSVKSSSSRGNMSGAFNSALSYGEFIDPRDNRTYKTIVIDGYEYFAENLNYGKQISGSTEQTDSTKNCYNDDPWYCESHYGGLYRWSVAMGFPRACDTVALGSGLSCPDTIALPVINPHQELAPQYPQVRGICPEGWHVMNQVEWGNILGGGLHGQVQCVAGQQHHGLHAPCGRHPFRGRQLRSHRNRRLCVASPGMDHECHEGARRHFYRQ
jgi:uncharacterized protein (TIGR02145 family)